MRGVQGEILAERSDVVMFTKRDGNWMKPQTIGRLELPKKTTTANDVLASPFLDGET